MRRFFGVLVVLFSSCSFFSQQGVSMFTFGSNGKVVINERFISEELVSLPFSTNAIGSISIGESTYVVKMGRFEDWEEEPGDFNVIQFYTNDRLVLTYKDQDGIVRLNDSKNPYAYPLNKYSDNGYCIEVEVADSTKLLIFIGQHYGTDLAKLIIFVVTPEEVKLVYNQKVAITSVVKTENRFVLRVQSNIPNEDEEPELHEIRLVDGILKFK